MDYTTLKDTIAAYCENDFPETAGSSSLTSTEQLNTFIQQAEQRIYNTVQLLVARKSTTLTATPASPYMDAPADWLANQSMAVYNSSTGEYSFLYNKDVEFIREAYPDPTATGVPQYYSLYDMNTYILGPTPASANTFLLNYFAYPESIVTATTTWLGDNCDAALLYGALLEAYTFMKGEQDVIAIYQQRYTEAMDQLRQLAEGKNRQDTYRTMQVRVPVQ